MKYIIQRIIIGVGIALAVWFIKDTCFAATTVDQYVYRTVYQDQICVGNPLYPGEYACTDSPGSSQQTSTFTQFGNQTTGPKKIYQYYVRMGTPSTATSQFQANQSCMTTFDINYNPRNSQTNSTLEGIPTFQYFDGSNYVDMDGRMSIVRGSDDYSYKVTFSYTPPVQSRYIYVNIDLPGPVVRGSSSQAVNFRNGKTVCATSSTDTAIIEGTAQIVDSVEGVGGEVNDNLKDLKSIIQQFHTDMSSTLTNATIDDSYANSIGAAPDPYNSSGLSNLESQVDWNVSNDAFGLDTQTFATPMSFIWLQVNNFLGLDSNFMILISFFLCICFLALVVGR